MDNNLDIIKKKDIEETQKRRLAAYKDALDKIKANQADKENRED